jgi:putative lipoic acid-binding regulatory protein
VDLETLLSFPCELPIKVFGHNCDAFRTAAVSIARRHFADLRDTDVAEQLSREQRYLSLTITVRAESRTQVDALYRELTASDDILMVL